MDTYGWDKGGDKALLKFILDVLRGIVIGIANVIPGVSGGTMMVSMGVYDDIIGSINNLFKQFKKSILTLLPYVIGMLIGIVGFAKAIEMLFEKFPIPTALLFIGLIFGGIPMMWKRATKKKIDVLSVILFALFFALVIGLQFLGNMEGVDKSLDFSIPHMFIGLLIGVVAAATMIIPGVSGSMVMMVLGYYNTIIAAINLAVDSLVSADFPGLFKAAGILAPFGIGVVVGIFAVAKLIHWLLKNHEAKTYCAILGLVVASPYPVYVNSGVTSVTTIAVIIGIIMFAVGFFGALKLGEK
ncbi:MAG: DUF368 domain-containing protein [Lachnospiraceae bacterium]|nr:DUF368 domain-containing protein [Lachnospiraceae bacterium]